MRCKEMFRTAPRWPGIPFLLSLLVAPLTSSASADQFRLVQEETKARAEVIASQLELEEWKLQQLITLRRRGHASWLEVARQETSVEILRAEQTAELEFAVAVQSLVERARQARSASGVDSPLAEDRPPVIKLSLPGSVRLVAWLAPEHATPELLASYLRHCREALDPEATADRLAAAERRLSTIQRRLRRLEKISPAHMSKFEMERARLDFGMARAELELAQALQRREQAEIARADRWAKRFDEEGSEPPLEAALLTAAMATHVSHESNSALREQTRRVAAAESQRTGELAVARIELDQRSDRWESIRTLHAQGFASQRELQEAQEKMEAAQSHLAELRGCQQGRESYQAALFPATEVIPVSASKPPLHDRSRIYASPPTAVLIDSAAIGHLIELLRQEAITVAQWGAATATLQLREAILSKLEAIPSPSTPDENRLPVDPLEASLARRSETEREDARREVERQRARLRAAEERRVAVRLEQDRFCQQMATQLDDPRRAPAGSSTADSSRSATTQLVALDANQLQSISYIESLELLRHTRSCRLFLLDRFSLSAPLGMSCPYSPLRFSRGARSWRGDYQPLSLDLYQRGAIGWYTLSAAALDCRTYYLRAPRYLSRPPSYYDDYPLGIRRPDLRSLPPFPATSYGLPWYLPGGPTNF